MALAMIIFSKYSLVTEGDSAGSYKWYLSDEASRHTSVEALYNSSGLNDIYDPDKTEIEDWNITSDSIGLAPGISSANYTSRMENLGHDIISINVSFC